MLQVNNLACQLWKRLRWRKLKRVRNPSLRRQAPDRNRAHPHAPNGCQRLGACLAATIALQRQGPSRPETTNQHAYRPPTTTMRNCGQLHFWGWTSRVANKEVDKTVVIHEAGATSADWQSGAWANNRSPNLTLRTAFGPQPGAQSKQCAPRAHETMPHHCAEHLRAKDYPTTCRG